MTDAKGKAEKGDDKAAKGAMKEAIGMITGDQAAESDGARDKATGRQAATAARKGKTPPPGQD